MDNVLFIGDLILTDDKHKPIIISNLLNYGYFLLNCNEDQFTFCSLYIV